MKPDLIAKLLKVWDAHVAAQLPSFERSASEHGVGEGRIYVDRSLKPTFFIFIQISDKRDAFTVELAWSQNGNFPAPADNPMPRDWPEFEVIRADRDVEQFRFRLTKLWEIPKHDPWWEFQPRTGSSGSARLSVVADQDAGDEAKCEQLVADAVQKILSVGYPYMREVRARAGLSQQSPPK